MDERFPKWLRVSLRKLDFLGLPNLGILICGLAILGFIGKEFLGAPLERFMFDPELVREGEWWRLFAYPISAELTNPLWLFFYVLYVYFVMSSLEGQWGPGPLTIFTLLSYASTIIGSIWINRPVSVWFHVMENISLAFGTLFPDLELYLFFVIPVKAKWLSLFAGGLLLLQFVSGGGDTRLFLAVTLFPYLLFFGPFLFSTVRRRWAVRRNRRRFNGDDWRR